MDRRVLLIGALVLTGCYLSHERRAGADGGPADAGAYLPRCVPSFRDRACDALRPEHFAPIVRQVSIDGTLHDACFCSPISCWGRFGCQTLVLDGDDQDLVCAESIPASTFGGFCVRECETSEDCPGGMACLSLRELLGRDYTRERACFDVAPAVETSAE